MNGTDLLHELAPEAERLLERHLMASKEWFPHQLVPWSRTAGSDPRDPWTPDLHPIDDAVRRALVVNLLSEDNLPYYTSDLGRLFGPDHPWVAWSRRWTAEEARHSIAMRDYITVSRIVDPVALERARMQQMTHGFRHPIADACEGWVYVTLEELATRICHRNTGKLIGEPEGYEVMARVAADENLHFLFYRDVASAALSLDPSTMVLAMDRQVRAFQMPGTGIEGFRTHAIAMADAGIYDMSIHYSQILVPVVLHHWRLEAIDGLSPEAEQARRRLVDHIEKVGRLGRRRLERRQEKSAAAAL